MIHTDFYMTRNDGVELCRTYSDAGKRIRQIETGIVYDEAIDIVGRYTYEETNEPIADDDGYLNAQDALNYIMGEGGAV